MILMMGQLKTLLMYQEDDSVNKGTYYQAY